jgi:hypothetical protein
MALRNSSIPAPFLGRPLNGVVLWVNLWLDKRPSGTLLFLEWLPPPREPVLGAFQGEQEFLRLQTSGEPSQVARSPNGSMTRNDNRNRIAPVGGSHRAHSAGMADTSGDLAVAARLTKRDFAQSLPDFILEFRPHRIELDGKGLALAGEIFPKLTFGLQEHVMILVLNQRTQTYPFRIVIFPKDGAQSFLRSHQLQNTDRRITGFIKIAHFAFFVIWQFFYPALNEADGNCPILGLQQNVSR